MTLNNFRYLFSQGVKGVFVNGWISIMTIGVVTITIALFGAFVLLGININYLADQIQEQTELQACIIDVLDRDQVREIQALIGGIDGVKDTNLYSKEEQWDDYRESWKGQERMIAGLGEDNPMQDIIKITLTDLTRADEIDAQVSTIEGVEYIINSRELFEKVVAVTSFVRWLSVFLLLILGFVAVFIISNTIRMGIFSRRREINIMKFVGATNGFIRSPFLIEGMALGVIGAVVSGVLLLWIYGAIVSATAPGMIPLKLSTVGEVWTAVIFWLLAMGAGIGWVGSLMSIRKHLSV